MFRPRAENGEAYRRAFGRSRGGFTRKLHCLADAWERPPAFHLTVGGAADCKACDALIALPERALKALLADKGYDVDTIRADLAKRNIQAVTPDRSDRRVTIRDDRTLYEPRNRIERNVRPDKNQPRHHNTIRSTRRRFYEHGPYRHRADTGSNSATLPRLRNHSQNMMVAAR